MSPCVIVVRNRRPNILIDTTAEELFEGKCVQLGCLEAISSTRSCKRSLLRVDQGDSRWCPLGQLGSGTGGCERIHPEFAPADINRRLAYPEMCMFEFRMKVPPA
jgi:hypothetical protein